MSGNDYTKLDEAIIRAIRGGATTFSSIASQGNGSHVIDEAGVFTGCGVDRLIDRRLQALRKLGVVEFKGGKLGWVVR